jgi:epsilon-lactone hydrolase
MPSKELDNVIQLLKSMPVAQPASMQEMRAEMEKMAFLQAAPESVALAPVQIGSLPAEWVVPDNARENVVILYLHGGGYCIGSIRTHRALAARIAEASKARALLIDYRLAPENPFPAAVTDAVTAYRWLIKEKKAAQKIIIAGDSAGGGLTLSALIDLRDNRDPLPAAAVCISPWTDLAMTGQSITTKAAVDPMVQREGLAEMAKAYLEDADPRSPLASPLYGNFKDLPPLLIHVGTAEVLLDDSARLAEKAAADGVSVTYEAWEDMIHVWHAFADVLPEAVDAIDKIGKFVLLHT